MYYFLLWHSLEIKILHNKSASAHLLPPCPTDTIAVSNTATVDVGVVVAVVSQSIAMSVSLSPAPLTGPSTSVDTVVIIGVVVAVVIVIFLLILAVFIIVLICMKCRDGSELEGCRDQDESYANIYT